AVKAAEFDALVIGGGWGGKFFEKTPYREQTERLVGTMLDAGKTGAALCMGPLVVANVGGVLGGPCTAFLEKPEVRAIMGAGGARLRDDVPVVEHGNIITSRDPKAAPELADTLIRRLNRPKN